MTIDCTGREATRTPATEAGYRKTYQSLRAQAARETQREENDGVLLTWYFAQDRRWREATVRRYRAALRYTIETIRDAGALPAADSDLVLEALATKPVPLERGTGPKRAAGKKRKSVPWPELCALTSELRQGDEWDQLAAAFLFVNLHLGLRPCEYTTVALVGAVLTVDSAKATNGRGLGPSRCIDLAAITERQPAFLPVFERFLANLHARRAEAGGDGKLWSRLAARLARACQRIGVRRVAPYTTRHLALATAKQLMSPEEVAALAGHKSTATATTHYARRRSGLAQRITPARPTQAAVRQVVASPKQNRDAHIAHRAGRQAAADGWARQDARPPSRGSP